MENFNANINLSRELFIEALPENELRIKFLEESLKDDSYFKMMEKDKKDKMDRAVNILIANAKVEETRKMQQAHFGPLIGKIRTQDANDIANLLKTDENAFIDFLQLFVIFLFRRDIENDNHSHESIRTILRDKCYVILKNLKE